MIRVTIVDSICRGILAVQFYNKYIKYIPKEFVKKHMPSPHGSLSLPLRPNSPELQQAIEELNQYGCEVTLYSRVYYTPAELKILP